MQSALPYPSDKASIILNGSVLAFDGSPGWGAYTANQGVVCSITGVLASELPLRYVRLQSGFTGRDAHDDLIGAGAYKSSNGWTEAAHQPWHLIGAFR